MRLKNRIAKWFLIALCAILYLPVVALVSSRLVQGQESEVLSLEAHIPLPNVKGRIDHFSVDVKGQRLFVAAVENHTLEVLDLKSGSGFTPLPIWPSHRECSMTRPPTAYLWRVVLMVSPRSLMAPHFKFLQW